MKVPSGWPLWNDGDNVCAWQFGPLVTHVTRPFDYALNVIILFLFLFKLGKLQSTIKTMRENERTRTRDSITGQTLSPTSASPEPSTSSRTSTGTSPGGKRRRRRRAHTNLEIVARRMSYLTFVAIISSVIVTGGYLGYSV
eukprot:290326_1